MQQKLIDWTAQHLKGLLIAVFLLRGSFLLFNDISLVGDESYYWDWSRHPDWCYFSKPPMVAWLIGSFTWLLGDSTAALRLPALLSGMLFLWFFHATAQAFYGRTAAAFALLLMLATPNNVLANLIMTIDPPLYCFWMITLYYLRRAIFDQQASAWFWAGCANAAALLSKQVAVALPLLLLVFILLDRRRYGCFRQGFWLYLAPILAAAIPILLWNQQHDWILFSHSKTHFTTQIAGSLLVGFKYAGELVLYQMLLISPLIFVLTVIISIQLLWRFNRLTGEQQFLVLTGPLLLLGVLLLGFEQKVQGNWPMPFYFSALILLSGAWQQGRWHKTLQYGLFSGFFLVAITYLLPVVLHVCQLENTRLDPIRRFKHWPAVAAAIQTERQNAFSSADDSFVLALGHRNLASQLAFYLLDHPKVYRYEVSGAVLSQYELWPGPEEFMGADALVVSDAKEVPEAIKSAFLTFSFLAEVANPMHPKQPFYLFKAVQLQHWPSMSRQVQPEEAL